MLSLYKLADGTFNTSADGSGSTWSDVEYSDPQYSEIEYGDDLCCECDEPIELSGKHFLNMDGGDEFAHVECVMVHGTSYSAGRYL